MCHSALLQQESRILKRIDPDLCLPLVRSHVERQIGLIAQGEANYEEVVRHTIAQLRQKFFFFQEQVHKMDELFEATFTSLAETGKPLSKCGICARYMKYIAARPSRLYCPTCEAVYAMPQGGMIKLYKEITCPLDGFELVLYVLSGEDGRSYPLCPYCYSHPPFEDIAPVYGGMGGGGATRSGGMPCTVCPHTTCPNSVAQLGVCGCPECEDGVLVLDRSSAPKWRLDCNRCACMVGLPRGAHHIRTTEDKCGECGSTCLEVNFNKKDSPLAGDATVHRGCILCDELLHSRIEVKHAKATFGRRRGGGRKGGRGRGRGGKGNEDPKMSFRDF
ncbi:hypothetical protein CYMTET_8628 [Cymbomonas tetramitiformis]|uniref:DNA topoisomerase n=1 Tax=Cymbomonas tetramitiformis TaxID=36881 RepID=A0AAE0LFT6_9CHLO|nr:hypothetical protein CYMTET_8628 [Cymbomonas tetramitiformis]